MKQSVLSLSSKGSESFLLIKQIVAPLFHLGVYDFANPFEVFIHVGVGESKLFDFKRFEIQRSYLVVSLMVSPVMATPVEFDRKTNTSAVEINDVLSDDFLSNEGQGVFS